MMSGLRLLSGSFLRAPLTVALFALGYASLYGCTSLEKPEVVIELKVTASGPWETGSIHPVRWDVPENVGPLDPTATVIVSHDEGATWFELEETPADEGYYRWTVPEGYSKARLGLLFHHTGEAGVIEDVAMAEGKDVSLVPTTKGSYVWEKVIEDAPFGPRDGSAGVVHDGKMWLIGGWEPSRFPLTTANDVWSSPDGKTWTEVKKNTFLSPDTFDRKRDWEGRHFFGAHVFNGKMWIVGGDANQGYYQNDIWSSTDGKQWARTDVHTVTPRVAPTGEVYPDDVFRPVEEPPFGRRTAAITGIFKGGLYLMGGQTIASFVNPEWPGRPAAAFNDVWFSQDGASFKPVATSGPVWSGRGFVDEAVTFHDKMWVVGGGLYDDAAGGRADRAYANDVWFTADGSRWESVADEAPFSPRFWHNVKVYDGRLWVINGYDGTDGTQGRAAGNLSDVWYTGDGRNWYPANPPAAFVPRHAGTAWVFEDALYVGSGNAIDTKWHADMWRMKRAP